MPLEMIPDTLQLIVAGLSMLSGTIIGAVAVKHLLSKLPHGAIYNFATAALIHALWPLTYFGEAAALHGTAGKTIFLALLLTPVGWPVPGSTACWRGTTTAAWPKKWHPGQADTRASRSNRRRRIKPRPEAERPRDVPLFLRHNPRP